MQITRHAVERYRERVRPAGPAEVRRQIRGIAEAAEVERDFEDGRYWLRAGNLRLVVYLDSILTLIWRG